MHYLQKDAVVDLSDRAGTSEKHFVRSWCHLKKALVVDLAFDPAVTSGKHYGSFVW